MIRQPSVACLRLRALSVPESGPHQPNEICPEQVIAPIRSRCVCLRVAAPSHNEICSVLDNLCQKEGIKLPPALALKISMQSDRNLRRAILSLEACKVPCLI